MLLSKSLELTEKSLEFDRMLRDCNHLSGKELEIHREKMDELASVLQKVRSEVNELMQRKEKDDYRYLYLNPLK